MVVDTSAVIALLLQEEDAERIVKVLLQVDSARMAAPCFLEIAIVLGRRQVDPAPELLLQLLQQLNISLVPMDEEQILVAVRAFQRFGKGRHPAKLNFGDCFSYALAMHLEEPLLFKGEDFSRTDVRIARW